MGVGDKRSGNDNGSLAMNSSMGSDWATVYDERHSLREVARSQREQELRWGSATFKPHYWIVAAVFSIMGLMYLLTTIDDVFGGGSIAAGFGGHLLHRAYNSTG